MEEEHRWGQVWYVMWYNGNPYDNLGIKQNKNQNTNGLSILHIFLSTFDN